MAPPLEPLPVLLLESALVARPLSRPYLFACDPSEGPGLLQPLRSPLRLLGLGAGLTALSSRQWTPVGVYLAREERCLLVAALSESLLAPVGLLAQPVFGVLVLDRSGAGSLQRIDVHGDSCPE